MSRTSALNYLRFGSQQSKFRRADGKDKRRSLASLRQSRDRLEEKTLLTIMLNATPIKATEGESILGAVASFQDTAASPASTGFKVTFDRGDGSGSDPSVIVSYTHGNEKRDARGEPVDRANGAEPVALSAEGYRLIGGRE